LTGWGEGDRLHVLKGYRQLGAYSGMLAVMLETNSPYMTDKIDDFFESKGKQRKVGFTDDQKKDMKWITEKVIHPALKTFKEKTDKRESMSADIINSKKDTKDLHENYELRIRENHTNKLSYSITFALSDKGDMIVNRVYSKADIYDEFSSPTTEKFELKKSTDLTEELIKTDIIEKLKDAMNNDKS
jgi:hypothetical protein